MTNEAATADGNLGAQIQSRLPSGKALSEESLATVRRLLDSGARPDAAVDVAARLGLLEHRLRCAVYERDAARIERQQISERYAAREKPTQEMVERLWALVDHRRKTLSMKALYETLTSAPGGTR